MLERRELKGIETTYISMKIPAALYEFLRTEAFEKKKTLSVVIQEALDEHKRKKEAKEDGGSTNIK